MFGILALLLVICAIESMSWGFAAFATRTGVLHFYRPQDLFARLPEAELAEGTKSNGLGWPSHDNPRATSAVAGPVCASAFGDSFTFGFEVEDDEAWVHLLSTRSGCAIRNYGVSGYGLDQVVLRYERIAPLENVVILGLITEMPRRSLAASWTFYASGQPPRYSSIKPYFTSTDEGLRLHPIPTPLTRESIAAHHANDYFMEQGWTTPGFPNAVQVTRAIFRSAMRSIEYRLLTDTFWDVTHPSGSGVLARRLVERLMQASRHRNQHIVIVLMPTIDRLSDDTPHYDQFVNELRQRGDVCVIDTKAALQAQARLVGPKELSTSGKHYNALGNRVIADEVSAGLNRCGIKLV